VPTSPDAEPLDLLAFLEAVVSADRGPPGFRGRLCFGVRAERETRWLLASFLDDVHMERPPTMPEEFDVGVGVSDEVARAMMRGETPKTGLLAVTGDQELLTAFTSRYLKRKSFLDVRASQAKR
jgi:hypothetical protein